MKNIFLLLCMLGAFCCANAQTIIKDWKAADPRTLSDSSALMEMVSSGRGMLVPKLTTAQRNAISNPKDGLMIFNIDEGCFDYYQLSTASWITSCGSVQSIITITTTQCNAITANGTYAQGVALTPANYLAVPVTVTTAGTYTISGTTANGYFFSAGGTLPSAGNFTINVPGTGTPSASGTDNVTLILNGVKSSCVPKIKI